MLALPLWIENGPRTGMVHKENVGPWSKVVLNAPGPPRGVVVPAVHPVYPDLLRSRLFEILPKNVDQGGSGGTRRTRGTVTPLGGPGLVFTFC